MRYYHSWTMAESDIPKVDFLKKKKGHHLEFEIMALEDLLAKKDSLAPHIGQPHRVLFHNIIYITAGEGAHYVDFQPYAIDRGSLIFIAQDQVHAFDIHSGLHGYVLLFTAEYLKKNLIHSDLVSLYRLYNYHPHTPVLPPHETRPEAFHHLFKEIEREYSHPDLLVKDEILRLLLKVLLLKAERITKTIAPEQKNTEWFLLFGRFKEQLLHHYAFTRSVKEYAGMLRISPKHLNTICKSVSGSTAKQCIDNFLVLEIKRVLATSNGSVQEISYDFGFDEPTNFVKFFKKHTDHSPAQFRNRLKK